jgi:hypothetical protein
MLPVIVELTNSKEISSLQNSENTTTVDFNLLEPALFTLRAIYDENKNKVYDSEGQKQKTHKDNSTISSQ